MSFIEKKIVCLAKSRKLGGFCIAGKEITKDNKIGNWVRPVSSRDTGEISHQECCFQNRRQPHLLDIVEIPFKTYEPNCFQCENYLIDNGYYWYKEGTFPKHNLNKLLDKPESLWGIDCSSYYGQNDRVRECNIDEIKNSLYLITPTELSIEVFIEGEEFGNPRLKVRAGFKYNNNYYLFSITDPAIEKHFRSKRKGSYKLKNPENKIYMCVSIGLPWNLFCYKFVASIITA